MDTAAIIVLIVIGALLAAELVALTALLIVVQDLVRNIRERMDPLLEKAEALADTLNGMAQTVQSRTEHIAETTANASAAVADRVKRTSSVLQRMLLCPLISSAAAAQGVGSAVTAWRSLKRLRRQYGGPRGAAPATEGAEGPAAAPEVGGPGGDGEAA